MSTIKLSYAALYQPEEMENIAADVEKILSPAVLLQSSWFKTQSLNQQNAAVLADWQQIKLQIEERKLEQLKIQLNKFSLSVDNIIKQHQILARKKMALVHLAELIEFLLIISAGIFLFNYSKKQITLPIEQLVANVTKLKAQHFDIDFPNYKNEIGLLSQEMEGMSKEVQNLIDGMQREIKQKKQSLEKTDKTIEFLFSISQQLSTVKLTSPILSDALDALAKQANLSKVCIELNNGTFIHSELGCATLEPNVTRIPIIINTKPYGFLNYIVRDNEEEQSRLIESFTGLIARALYQEECCLQTQKILLMEEQGINARELHDSVARSLSFLQTQCSLLHRQVDAMQQLQAEQTINTIEAAAADADMQLRSLRSTCKLAESESDFKDAISNLVNEFQKKTSALISIKEFETHFYTDLRQRIQLLHIVREAFINAVNHAQCTTIDVSCVITEDDNICIHIIDDGIAEHNEDDTGVAMMKRRAAELNGILSVTPLQPGTAVKLLFPYKKSSFNQQTKDV